METQREKIMMYVCPTCKVAEGVRFDTKGDSLDNDIYTCEKCGYSFVVTAVCDKCDGAHSRSYGCNTMGCGSENYHYDHDEGEIEI